MQKNDSLWIKITLDCSNILCVGFSDAHNLCNGYLKESFLLVMNNEHALVISKATEK